MMNFKNNTESMVNVADRVFGGDPAVGRESENKRRYVDDIDETSRSGSDIDMSDGEVFLINRVSTCSLTPAVTGFFNPNFLKIGPVNTMLRTVPIEGVLLEQLQENDAQRCKVHTFLATSTALAFQIIDLFEIWACFLYYMLGFGRNDSLTETIAKIYGFGIPLTWCPVYILRSVSRAIFDQMACTPVVGLDALVSWLYRVAVPAMASYESSDSAVQAKNLCAILLEPPPMADGIEQHKKFKMVKQRVKRYAKSVPAVRNLREFIVGFQLLVATTIAPRVSAHSFCAPTDCWTIWIASVICVLLFMHFITAPTDSITTIRPLPPGYEPEIQATPAFIPRAPPSATSSSTASDTGSFLLKILLLANVVFKILEAVVTKACCLRWSFRIARIFDRVFPSSGPRKKFEESMQNAARVLDEIVPELLNGEQPSPRAEINVPPGYTFRCEGMVIPRNLRGPPSYTPRIEGGESDNPDSMTLDECVGLTHGLAAPIEAEIGSVEEPTSPDFAANSPHLQEFIDRRLQLGSIDWDDTGLVDVNGNTTHYMFPYYDVLNMPIIREKLIHVAMMRITLEVIFEVASTDNITGLLMGTLHFAPETFEALCAPIDSATICEWSQKPHVLISPGVAKFYSLEIPFVLPSIGFHPRDVETQKAMCALTLHQLAPLSSATGSVPRLTCNVLVKIKDVATIGATGVRNPGSGSRYEIQGQPALSIPAIPGAGCSVVSYTHDKVLSPDYNTKLDGVKELKFHDLIGEYSIVSQGVIDSNNKPGDVLMDINVTPMILIKGTSGALQPAACAAAALFHEYWNGDMEYKLLMAVPKMSGCKLAIVSDPLAATHHGSNPEDIYEPFSLDRNEHIFVDPSTMDDFEFTVAYSSCEPGLNTCPNAHDSSHWDTANAKMVAATNNSMMREIGNIDVSQIHAAWTEPTLSCSTLHSGRFQLQVYQKLTTMADQFVSCRVFLLARCAPNMRFWNYTGCVPRGLKVALLREIHDSARHSEADVGSKLCLVSRPDQLCDFGRFDDASAPCPPPTQPPIANSLDGVTTFTPAQQVINGAMVDGVLVEGPDGPMFCLYDGDGNLTPAPTPASGAPVGPPIAQNSTSGPTGTTGPTLAPSSGAPSIGSSASKSPAPSGFFSSFFPSFIPSSSSGGGENNNSNENGNENNNVDVGDLSVNNEGKDQDGNPSGSTSAPTKGKGVPSEKPSLRPATSIPATASPSTKAPDPTPQPISPTDPPVDPTPRPVQPTPKPISGKGKGKGKGKSVAGDTIFNAPAKVNFTDPPSGDWGNYTADDDDAVAPTPRERLTVAPSVNEPVAQPTPEPSDPSLKPTALTGDPSYRPSELPTWDPTTGVPSFGPTKGPTGEPTKIPSVDPTVPPSKEPTPLPTTVSPTGDPSKGPTPFPTTVGPTGPPTPGPTNLPTTVSPTGKPTPEPTFQLLPLDGRLAYNSALLDKVSGVIVRAMWSQATGHVIYLQAVAAQNVVETTGHGIGAWGDPTNMPACYDSDVSNAGRVSAVAPTIDASKGPAFTAISGTNIRMAITTLKAKPQGGLYNKDTPVIKYSIVNGKAIVPGHLAVNHHLPRNYSITPKYGTQYKEIFISDPISEEVRVGLRMPAMTSYVVPVTKCNGTPIVLKNNLDLQQRASFKAKNINTTYIGIVFRGKNCGTVETLDGAYPLEEDVGAGIATRIIKMDVDQDSWVIMPGPDLWIYTILYPNAYTTVGTPARVLPDALTLSPGNVSNFPETSRVRVRMQGGPEIGNRVTLGGFRTPKSYVRSHLSGDSIDSFTMLLQVPSKCGELAYAAPPNVATFPAPKPFLLSTYQPLSAEDLLSLFWFLCCSHNCFKGGIIRHYSIVGDATLEVRRVTGSTAHSSVGMCGAERGSSHYNPFIVVRIPYQQNCEYLLGMGACGASNTYEQILLYSHGGVPGVIVERSIAPDFRFINFRGLTKLQLV